MNIKHFTLVVALVVLCQSQIAFACVCEDVSPTPEHDCAEQKVWGKCKAKWMISGGFCKKTCGRCDCVEGANFKSTEEEETMVVKEARVESGECDLGCTDVAPDSDYTCEEQAAFGKCDSPWMLSGGYCDASCGRCTACEQEPDQDTKALPSESEICEDIPPGDDLTCAEQREYGKCERPWMVEGNYCAKTCDRCKVGKLASSGLPPLDQLPKEPQNINEIQVITEVLTEVEVIQVEQPDVEDSEDENKKAKVRQDIEELLAQNSDLKYEEVLGYELSRGVIQDALNQRYDGASPAVEMKVSPTEAQEALMDQVQALINSDNSTEEFTEAEKEEKTPEDPSLEKQENRKGKNKKNQNKNNADQDDQEEVRNTHITASEGIQEYEEVAQDNQTDVVSAVSAPITAVFGAGSLKDLADEVPGIADMFGSAAAGVNISSENIEQIAKLSLSEEAQLTQNQERTDSIQLTPPEDDSEPKTPEVQDAPKAPKRQLSPLPSPVSVDGDIEKVSSPAPKQPSPQQKATNCKTSILDEISLHPDLSLLSSILQKLDFNGLLLGKGSPITLLAPDNASLTTFLESNNIDLDKDSAALKSLKHLILYHMLEMPYSGEEMTDIAIANTKLGSEFPVFVEGSGSDKVVFEALHSVGEIAVKDAAKACGSVVHIIEGVLMPFEQFKDIPKKDVDVSAFLSPPPPPPNPSPSPVPVPSPEPIPSPACHISTPFEILREHDEVSLFVDFMKTFGILNQLEMSNTPTTIFVPTNEAITFSAAVLGSDKENLLNDFLSSSNTQLVNSILAYHIINNERVGVNELSEDVPLKTVQGEMLFPEEAGSQSLVSIQGVGSTAKIIKSDVDANACQVSVHFIDTLLLPFAAGSVVLNTTLNSMKECQDQLLPGVPSCQDVVQAGLCEDSGVQEGGYCLKSCGLCTTQELQLGQSSIVLESAPETRISSEQKSKPVQDCTSIEEVLKEFWDLSIFRSLIDESISSMMSKNKGPLTIFAPNDAAFRALLSLPDGRILEDSTADVLGLMSYHTVNGYYTAEDLAKGEELVTMNPKDNTSKAKMTLTSEEQQDASIRIVGTGSEAKITSQDINICSGIIHVIDNVLLPINYSLV